MGCSSEFFPACAHSTSLALAANAGLSLLACPAAAVSAALLIIGRVLIELAFLLDSALGPQCQRKSASRTARWNKAKAAGELDAVQVEAGAANCLGQMR